MFFAESSLLAVGGILIGLVLGALLVLLPHELTAFISAIWALTGMLIGERIYAYLTLRIRSP